MVRFIWTGLAQLPKEKLRDERQYVRSKLTWIMGAVNNRTVKYETKNKNRKEIGHISLTENVFLYILEFGNSFSKTLSFVSPGFF